MANIKSQKKRNITNAKRAERNKAAKSELKTRVKTATTSIATDATHEPSPGLASIGARSSTCTRTVSTAPVAVTCSGICGYVDGSAQNAPAIACGSPTAGGPAAVVPELEEVGSSEVLEDDAVDVVDRGRTVGQRTSQIVGVAVGARQLDVDAGRQRERGRLAS